MSSRTYPGLDLITLTSTYLRRIAIRVLEQILLQILHDVLLICKHILLNHSSESESNNPRDAASEFDD